SAGHITLTGSAVEQGQSGSTALSAVTIAAYQNGADATPVVTATSDAQGNYSLALDVPTFDGYVKASKSGYADTFLYPAAPWSQDATIQTSLLSSSTYSLLDTFAAGEPRKSRDMLTTPQICKTEGAPP